MLHTRRKTMWAAAVYTGPEFPDPPPPANPGPRTRLSGMAGNRVYLGPAFTVVVVHPQVQGENEK